MIWLLRHAEAADGSPDAERPLTGRGEGQARTAGAALAALGVEIDACLTSPKVRAQDTARLVCEALGTTETVESSLQGGPFDPYELVEGLGEEVLLVGHDPDFSMAVHRLTGAQVRMKKGGIAAVHKGELKLLPRPHELAAIAQTVGRAPA
ncbi:MAG: SixA phosphatase family protein [Solirubrobacteraceae bacterium]